MKTAVVFLTHRFDAELRERYEKLKREAPEGAAVRIMADNRAQIPATLAGETHVFDFAVLRKRAVKVIGERLVPGNVHLAFLDFSDANPGFDRYWFIEYDVVFSGSWRTFFAAYENDPSDLVSGNVRGRADEPGWSWWTFMDFPGGPSGDRWLRSFFPLCRITRAALDVVAKRVGENWTGHHEGLIPTAVREAGLAVSDLGGDGPFTPEARRRRFYTSVSSAEGEMLLGTLRAAPPHFLPPLIADAVYHPVKQRKRPHWGDVLKMRQRLGVLLRGRLGAWALSYWRLRRS